MTTSNEAPIETPEGKGPRSPLPVLLASERGMELHARVGRARWFFLFAWVCSILLGAAVAARVDARSTTLQKLEMSGQLRSMSDRQIEDETRAAERVAQVASVAKGVAAAPLQLGLACAALIGLCWFFRGRVKGRAVVPVAAATLVPGAIANLLDAVSAFRHVTLPPQGATLSPRSLSAVLAIVGRPLSDPGLRFGNALDFFSLWAAIILGYGVAAVGQIKKRNALIGTLIAWVCYRLLTNVASGGPPRP